MTTAIEYALMAGAAYISNRADVNQFPIPVGCSDLPSHGRSSSSPRY